MIRKFYVEINITVSLEFEADDNLTNSELEQIAIENAKKEHGEFDDYDIRELDYA